MKKNSPALLALLVLLTACRGGDMYRRIRVELPAYSTVRPEQFEQVVFSGFLVAKESAGLDLNKEIIEYLSPEFEKRLNFRVASQPVGLAAEGLFQTPDFWRSLASETSRSLFVTGNAEFTRDTRKAVLGRRRTDDADPLTQQKEIAERTVFTLSLHLYLIRGDSGEIVLERDFRETKVYPNPKQRADFAFFDLVQRVKAKLFRQIMSEERIQERYLLLK